MSEEKTGTLNMFYVANNRSQFLIEGLLNYANSNELINHNSIYSNEEYDYEGLNKLYQETLECFKLNLIAVNDYLDEPEQVDVSKLILKKHD